MWGRFIPVIVLSFGAIDVFDSPAKLKFDENSFVYTSNLRGYKREEVQPLFENLLRGKRPVVLFIHGRGNEPAKSLQGTSGFVRRFGVEGLAVKKLESYGVSVILFSWDSRRGKRLRDRSRALKNMPQAVSRLAFVLQELRRAQELTTASGSVQVPVSLLAHSMGSIVLQEYVMANRGVSPKWPKEREPLFSSVVLSSPDADDIGHVNWVEQIGSVERVLVTINSKDPVLRRSREHRVKGSRALGLGTGSEVALSATYVHFQEDVHEIFAQRPKHRNVTAFFASIFAGGEILLGDPLGGPGRQFSLSRHSRAGMCF